MWTKGDKVTTSDGKIKMKILKVGSNEVDVEILKSGLGYKKGDKITMDMDKIIAESTFDSLVESIDDLLSSNKDKYMSPGLIKAADDLVEAFNKWRFSNGTVFADIKPAQKKVANYIADRLKKGK